MSAHDKLEGARNAFAMYFAFFDQVAKEIGTDRAVALSGMTDEAMGTLQGQAIREESGNMPIDARKAASLAKIFIKENFGIISKVENESLKKATIRCARCPIYDGAQMVGMEDAKIQTMCQVGPLQYMNAMVKQLNPDLSYRLKSFRTSDNGFCEEEVVMA